MMDPICHQKNELDRREFLRTAAGSSIGLIISLNCRLSFGVDTAPASFRPNAWLALNEDGILSFTLDKVEMGQGVHTSLSMIVAEELDINPEDLEIISAPAAREYVSPTSQIQITGGSTSVAQSFDNLRRSAATMRVLLIQAAANRWKTTTAECKILSKAVVRNSTRESFGFGQLAKDAALLTPPKEIPLKSGDFKVVGRQFQPRLDNTLKVTGKAIFGIDASRPELLNAVVIRSPQLGGRVESFDAEEAKRAPGVVAVFEVPSGVAIVATRFWQAKAARDLVQVKWTADSTLSKLDSASIEAGFRERLGKSGKELLNRGSLSTAELQCKRVVEAEYFLPYLAHAALEPCNFTADVRSDACYLHGPTQSSGIAQQLAVEITGLPYGKVFVETTFIGGGFGRRLHQDYVAEAVVLSQKLKRPVKVVWTREDDMQNSMYRPANLHRLKGGVNDKGELVLWTHKMAGPSILAQVAGDFARTSFPKWVPGWAKRIGGWAGQNSFEMLSNDTTAMEGASDLAYSVPNVSVEFCISDPGVPVGFWRSVGHSYTGFVVESFVDEMASAAGEDPFVFRKKLLGSTESARNLGVLELVAEKAQWPARSKKGIGRGIAQHASFGSWVAYVVDVSLGPDNDIRIERVVAAVDCGLVINPDGARAQIESAVNFALGAILKSEITLKDGTVEQSSFDSYEVLRFDEAPKTVEIHFVKNNHPPSGLGEPGVPPLGAAVANAVFALTGKRLRRLPLRIPG